ncbi:hypothetical protein ONS95_006045 [Cadophora gregata]|uniref:uncharacterized protein n=1 Tax=Cadophora gregata TaxID=51156 RepID=UPI0026DB388C|nr:uncharacterized protein ONS95_006045 [Cadophora gregata]KAK0102425.1 hypothetical protein ONS95_006045 [Cadophora gregata]KAK0104051.1 hypothetical protein ONS96_005154 [Cadophora gregata f. sp. sojae]
MAEDNFLSEKEITAFINDLDKNNNGHIEYDEVEFKLDQVHKELAPEAKPHNLHYKEKDEAQMHRRHAFLRSVIGTDKNQIGRDDFANIVRGWKVPSMEPDKKAEDEHKEFMKEMGIGRKIRAWWSVRGPEVLFVGMVVGMQIAFGTWQCVKYVTQMQYRHAFGWGVVMAKTSAGILYPTLFFLILSMSRYISTFARKSYYLSRFINWDLSQSFHIILSIVAIGFASLHAIGHLTGSFLYGSRPAQQDNVAAVLGPDAVPKPYRGFVATIPGWTGITALGLFYVLALLSMPMVRKKSYEIFQLGHLLMFPIIGLLCAHGTKAFLQFPMLGYWLALPTLLVLIERGTRIVNGFLHMPAKIEILDADTVAITVTVPNYRWWPYKAGQYVFLQVPKISIFQWHPFTVSTCIGNEMQLHIKTDGDWTSKLRDFAKDGPSQIQIGVDGPFGAPAQRFYDFDQAIVLGSGIGVTPFSGILADMQARDEHLHTHGHSDANSEENEKGPVGYRKGRFRRVDFHWIVKDRNYLLWFSDLLNQVSRSASLHEHDPHPHLDVNIFTHVTQKRKNLSTHIFRFLLECHRTEEHPASPLTGLLNKTHFGRPDLAKIMDEHYESMLEWYKEMSKKGIHIKKRKVGVFFCGAPPIGYELADRCQILTRRAREDKSYIEYHFMMEVFG